MNLPIHFLQWSVWVLALAFFLMMTWVSGTFFTANDPGAVRGRRIMAALAGGNAIFALWTLFPPTHATAIQLIPACLLFLYAIGMFIWAWQANRARPLNFVFSDQVPQHINQSGPYRLVRHPFYSTYCAAWLGTAAAAANNLLLVATCMSLIFIYRLAITKEEHEFEKSLLAMTYQEYKSKTNMLIPLPHKNNISHQHRTLYHHLYLPASFIVGFFTALSTETATLAARDLWPTLRGCYLKFLTTEYKISPMNKEHCKIHRQVCFGNSPCHGAQPISHNDEKFGWSSDGPNMGVTRMICKIPKPISWGELEYGGATTGGNLGPPNHIAKISARESVEDSDLSSTNQLPSTLMEPILVSSSEKSYSTTRKLILDKDKSRNAVIIVEFIDAWGKNTTVSIDFQPIKLLARHW